MSISDNENTYYALIEETDDLLEPTAFQKMAPYPGANGRNYFDEPQEKAVLYYIDPQTPRSAKDAVLTKLLHDQLRYMTEAIVMRYPKFVGVCGIEELVQMAFINLYEQLDKFKPFKLNKMGKVCKAYSYYGTIVRNFCKTHSEKTYKHESAHSHIDNMYENVRDELEGNTRYSYQLGVTQKEVGYETLKQDMTTRLRNKISNPEKIRPNDLKVGHALITVFESWNYIYEESFTVEEKAPTDFFLRKKIFQIIKDITGLTTKDISTSIRSFGEIYVDLFREQQAHLHSDDNEDNPEDEYSYEFSGLINY